MRAEGWLGGGSNGRGVWGTSWDTGWGVTAPTWCSRPGVTTPHHHTNETSTQGSHQCGKKWVWKQLIKTWCNTLYHRPYTDTTTHHTLYPEIWSGENDSTHPLWLHSDYSSMNDSRQRVCSEQWAHIFTSMIHCFDWNHPLQSNSYKHKYYNHN